MREMVAALILVGMTTIAPLTSDAAWASKNCPDGSHAGKGPDPKKVCCYDNAPTPPRS